jgi:hypothetical protein
MEPGAAGMDVELGFLAVVMRWVLEGAGGVKMRPKTRTVS